MNRFQTEYYRNYQWQPNRSAVYDISEGAPFAGKESKNMFTSHEPALQHKRRIVGSFAEDHLHDYHWDSQNEGDKVEDDFMLLGEQNNKFSQSIPYRNSAKFHSLRPKTAPPRDYYKTYNLESRNGFDNDVSTPEAPRNEKNVIRPQSADPRRRKSRRQLLAVSKTRGRSSSPHYQNHRRSKSAKQRNDIRTSSPRPINDYRSTYFRHRSGSPNHQRHAYHLSPSPNNDKYRPQSFYERKQVRPHNDSRHLYNTDKRFLSNNRDELEDAIRRAAKVKPRSNTFGHSDHDWNTKDNEKRFKRNFTEYNANRSFEDKEKNPSSHDRYFQSKQERRNIDMNKRAADHQIKRSVSAVDNHCDENYVVKKRYDSDLDREIEKLRNKPRQLEDDEFSEDNIEDKHYAKKHQLGIAPYRKRPIERNSEYQKEFDWKRPIGDRKGAYDDNDIVHRSYLSPPKRYRYPIETSEYRRQFAPDRRNRSASPNFRRQNKEYYKTAPEVNINNRNYNPATALNPQRMSFPLGPQRRHTSEYNSNFRDYWNEKQYKRREDDQYLMTPQWIKQVSELRRKVDEHRLKARGTHFSREHMAQLISQANRSWDPPPSSTINELPLGPMRQTKSTNQLNRSHSPQPAKIPLDSNDRDSYEFEELQEGRIPTPRAERSFKRHHLDKTTPVGVTAPIDVWQEKSALRPKSASQTYKSRAEYPAGKETDCSDLLDESASHDTLVNMTRNKQRTKYYRPDAYNRPKNDDYATTIKAGRRAGVRHPLSELDSDSNRVRSSSSLSTSVRSLASSESMAVETLERARRRNDVLRY